MYEEVRGSHVRISSEMHLAILQENQSSLKKIIQGFLQKIFQTPLEILTKNNSKTFPDVRIEIYLEIPSRIPNEVHNCTNSSKDS